VGVHQATHLLTQTMELGLDGSPAQCVLVILRLVDLNVITNCCSRVEADHTVQAHQLAVHKVLCK